MLLFARAFNTPQPNAPRERRPEVLVRFQVRYYLLLLVVMMMSTHYYFRISITIFVCLFFHFSII